MATTAETRTSRAPGAGDGHRRRARATRRAGPHDGCGPAGDARRGRHRRAVRVVANLGTTNAGAVDELDGIADVCAAHAVWLHVDGAYGGAALSAPSTAELRRGMERADSFGVDPHKWLFAPYDYAALVYREPALASAAHAQHGTYLDIVDRDEWNPTDFAFHLSRSGSRPAPVVQPGHVRHRRLRRGRRVDARRRDRRVADEVGGATGSRCCCNHSCRSPCSVDGWDDARYAAVVDRRGPTPVSRSWCRRGGPADLLPRLRRQPADHDRDADVRARRHGRLRALTPPQPAARQPGQPIRVFRCTRVPHPGTPSRNTRMSADVGRPAGRRSHTLRRRHAGA